MLGEKKVLPVFKVYSPSDLSRQWFVYYYEGSKRIRKYGEINKYTTHRARRRAARKLIDELKKNYLRKVSRVEETLRRYIESHSNGWRQKTREHYSSIANVLITFLDGREVTQDLIEQFLYEVRATRHPTTYNKYLSSSKRLLSACGYDFIFDTIKYVRAEPTPARYFQKHQSARILRRIDREDKELSLFIRFIYYCFIRPGELRLLKVGDILLEEGEIRVPGKIGKNKKTQFVAIPKAFLPDLNSLYDMAPGDYIFSSSRDITKPVGKNTMYRRHKRILDSLNFGEGYSLYSWKHTGAVAAAKAGVSMKELQIQLRHHSLDETDKYLRQMGVKDVVRLRENFPLIAV